MAKTINTNTLDERVKQLEDGLVAMAEYVKTSNK